MKGSRQAFAIFPARSFRVVAGKHAPDRREIPCRLIADDSTHHTAKERYLGHGGAIRHYRPCTPFPPGRAPNATHGIEEAVLQDE